jgi:crotonobetainyl-CoA:carnitine CoA-transferase CaiB-like acyl-CoA transferase
MYGAMCALTGLYHRNMTGQGQHIDLSQMVSSVPLNGPALLDFTVNGRSSRREGFPPGNRAHWPGTPPLNNYRGPIVAPHNAYRTDPGGYNDWCVIVCGSDEEWRRLVRVMSDPSWAVAPHFATVTGRLEHQEELDEGIEAWTRTLGKYEATERCQAAGVRALPVQSAEDRVEHDPQLRHREMYLPVEHPALGERRVQNAPFKLSGTPAFNHLPSPLIGQHTRDIVEGLLGYSRDELRAGFADGTFWPTKREPFPYMEEMLR